MPILKEKDKRFLQSKFERELGGEARIIVFTKKDRCEYCEPLKELVNEVSGLSEKIKAEFYDVDEDREKAERWEIDKAPAVILFGEREYRVRFFGIPSGYEFTAFIEDIVDVSKGTTRLGPKTREEIKKVDKPLHIQVFVTPTCPYCPRAVRLAHQFAIENEKITGDMIEALEFPELANRYQVMAVPKNVVNDKVAFEGALPEPHFLRYVLMALEEEVKKERAEGPVSRFR